MLFYPHSRPAGGLDGLRQRERSLCHRKRYFLSKPPCGVASAARRSLLSLVIASSIILSSRAQRGDLACSGMANQKERLPRFARNDKKYNREERSDLGCPGLAKEKERLLRRLAMTEFALAATAMNVKRNSASRAHSCGAGHSRSSIICACKRPKRHCSASQPRSDVDRNPVWLG